MHPGTPPEPVQHDPERFDVERRLAFLDLTGADAERLRALSPLFDQHARAFVDHFYQHLFRFPETTRFLQDNALIERLKAMQLAHLHSMLEATWGDEYVARRRRVGSV
ncbi:MAG TPA: protoglobin domain-containing protein, partial [Pirellulaceae bacterium]|nr:protoglobin domain-containing protein [Pirellulaceae bacterium]